MAFAGFRTIGGRAAQAAEQPPLTEEERASILAAAQGLAGGTVARIGDLLSAPGDYLRGVAASQPGQRVTGRELLRHFNLAGDEDTWGNFWGGLATDVVTDPLSLLTGPSGAVTPAGTALKRIGMTADDVASAATRRAIRNNTPLANLPRAAQRRRAQLEATGRTISEMDPAVISSPFYGRNLAMRDMTLDDLIQYSDDPAATLKKATDTLTDAEFQRVRGMPFRRDVGFAVPGFDPFATFDLPGGAAYADLKDLIGQGVRWSPVGRWAASAFDHRVDRAMDAEEQITNLAAFKRQQAAGGAAAGRHAFDVSRAATGDPDLMTSRAGRIMRRVAEGWGTPEDQAWMAAHPQAQQFLDNWRNVEAPRLLEESRRAGIGSNELTDRFGTRYVGRQTHPLLERAARSNPTMRSALSFLTGDQLGRSKALEIPGATDLLNRLSQDPRFVGSMRLPEAQATQELMDILHNYLPPPLAVDQNDVQQLAAVLGSLPEEATDKIPLFGQHLFENMGASKVGRAKAIQTANTIYDSLATWAVDQPTSAIPGGRHVTMQDALNRIGLKSTNEAVSGPVGPGQRFTGEGAAQNMRERMARILSQRRGSPVSADSINLASISIPEEAVQRLARAADVFQSDQAMGQLMKVMDHYTQLWRGSILAWPSRYTRDLYSGATSNWLSGAYTWEATRAAHDLTTNGPQSRRFQQWLTSIPRYQSADGLHLFQSDIAANRLVNGAQAMDAGAATSGLNALASLAGVGGNRATVMGAVRELGPQHMRTWRQAGRDFITYRSELTPLAETRNPVMRMGEKLNTLTDNINRISGFMALVQKGYAPDAAAAIVKRAQVDYTTLSSFERNFLKQIFPWYSYQSRIFREVLGQLAERPFGSRYGMLVKGSERAQQQGSEPTEEEYLPSALRAQFAMAIPEVLGGRPAPGTVRYLTDFDLPGFDQLNMVETPGTLAGTFGGTARQIGMQLNPVYRMGAEFAFGQDLFTNRPLGESTSPLDAITGTDVPAVIDKGLELLPFAARPLYAARSLLDTSGGASFGSRAVKTGVNAITGVKVRDVNPEYRLSDASRQLEKSIEPYTRDFSQTFIPKEMIPYVPQWANRRMQAVREINKDRKVLREKRAKSPGINPLD